MPTIKKAKIDTGIPSNFEETPLKSIIIDERPPTIPPEETDFSGDWDSSDLRLPRLELKHGVDTRYPTVAPGRFVYARSNEDFLELIPPFKVTFIRGRKGYLQVTEPGDIPMTAWTKAEVMELGGSLERNRPDASFFQAFADTLILIDHSAHPSWDGTTLLDIDGKKAAPASYKIKATAFREIGSIPNSWEKFQKMSGNPGARIHDVEWLLGSVLRTGPTFSYYVPTLKQARIHSDEERKQLGDIGGNL